VVVGWVQDSLDAADSEAVGSGCLVSEECVAMAVETARFVRHRGRAIEAMVCAVSSRRCLHVSLGTQRNSSSD